MDTPKLTDNETNSRPIVLYDDDCHFCRALASFTSKFAGSKITIMAAQSFAVSPYASLIENPRAASTPNELRVIDQDTVFEGVQAWEWLLSHHPALKQVGWIAERLGFATGAAQALRATGTSIRRLCSWCPRW